MIYPSEDLLSKSVESRYTLVVLAAKRAKQLREGARKLIDTASTNPLTIALQEIAAGKVTYRVPDHDDVPARGRAAEIEALPGLESAEEEAAEIVAEAAQVPDEAARVAQLLEVPATQEEETAARPEEESAAEPGEEAAAPPEEVPQLPGIEVEAAAPDEEPAPQQEAAAADDLPAEQAETGEQ